MSLKSFYFLYAKSNLLLTKMMKKIMMMIMMNDYLIIIHTIIPHDHQTWRENLPGLVSEFIFFYI